MRTRLMPLVPVLVALSLNLAPTNVILVPENYTTIQAAIDYASDGDVISVWGPPPGQPSNPPYHYYENVNYAFKSLVVASRCFLPNWQGDSTCDSVIIDGTQSGRVVTMTGSENSVLKGFTIQHGHTTGYGGGVNCNAGFVLKNHILNNYAASGGGGVYDFAEVPA